MKNKQTNEVETSLRFSLHLYGRGRRDARTHAHSLTRPRDLRGTGPGETPAASRELLLVPDDEITEAVATTTTDRAGSSAR